MPLTMLQPLSAFSSRPRSYSFDIASPSWGKPSDLNDLTANQMLRLRKAMDRDDDGGDSFWDKVKGGAGSVLSKALNVVLRPSWAVAEGTRRALEGEGFDVGDFVKGFSRGIQAKKKTLFSEVLEQEGILEDHGRLRGLAGFGLDVVTDPTNLLLFAATPVTGGGSLALLGGKLSAQQLARRAAVQTMREGTKLSRSELSKVKFNLASRTDFQPIKAYVDELDKFAILRDRGVAPTSADFARLSIASRAAAETYKQVVPRALQAQVRIPFSRGKYVPLTPTSILGQRVAPKAPTLSRTAGGEGILGHVPGVAAGASKLGQAFKLGFNDPLGGSKLTAKHVEESLAKKYTSDINQDLKPFVGMNADKQFDAMAWYDEPGALKAGELNEAKLAKSGMDKQQQDFVRMWHNIMERHKVMDRDYGLNYARLEKGRGYVPHLYSRDKLRVITKSQTAIPSYSKTRINKNISIREIREAKAKAGKEGGRIVDEPIELLQIHAKQAARAHAEKAYRDVVMRGFGVPYKVADKVRLGRVNKILNRQHQQSINLLNKTDPAQVQKALMAEKSRIGKKYAARARDITKASMRQRQESNQRIADILTEKQVYESTPRPPIFSELMRLGDKEIRDILTQVGADPKFVKQIMAARRAAKRGVKREQLKKFWQDYLEKLGYAKRPPFEAQIASIRKGLDRAEDRLAEKLAKNEMAKERAFASVERKVAKAVERNQKALDQLTEKIGKTERRQERALTANVNPIVAQRGLVRVKRGGLRGSHGEPYAFEPRIANAIERVEKVIVDDAAMSRFEEMWGRWLAMWKSVVTVINPGYRSRNSLSDVWNMYLDGVPAWAIPVYGAKAGRLMAHAKRATSKKQRGEALSDKEADAIRTLDDAYHDGILSGQFTGDIQTVAEIGRFGSPYSWMFRKNPGTAPVRAGLRAAHAFNRNAENVGRLTHYLYRREFEKMGRVEAAQHVRSAHFDYEELTQLEQRVFKNIAPFYTWTRKNIPFQIQQLVSRPGRMATFPKLVQESEAAAGGGGGDLTPEYIRENFGFKVPFGGDKTYLLPQIGFADLAKLEDPKKFAQLMNPAMKVTAEVLTGKSIFTGAPIEGTHPRVPVADPLGITSKILSRIPGTNIGRTERRVRGQVQSGLGISPWWAYAFGQLPATNEIFLRRSDIKKAQGGLGGKASLASYLGGLSMSELDEETSALIAQMQFEEEFERFMRGLRDENILPESEDDGFSDFERQIQELITESSRR